MRIALMISDLEGGGAETLVGHLRNGYEAAGHTATVFYARGPQHVGSSLSCLGVSLGPLCVPGSVWKALRSFRPDVVHSHVPWMGIQAGLESRFLRCRPPMVYTVHSRPSDKPRFLGWVEGAAIRMADAVVCVSASWSGDVRGRRVSAIPNGSPLVGEGPATANGHFLWLGRFLARKQPELFLAALQGTDYPAIVAGDGPLAQRVGDAAASNPKVQLTGWVDDSVGLMRGCRAVVFTSTFEGLPMVALEAMSVGVPLVIPDLPEFRYVLPADYPFFYEPGVEQALRAVMQMVAENPAVSASVGEQLREHHAVHYSVETVVARYLELLESLVELRIAR